MAKRSGLTLFELILILACILVLAAILFPVFSKAREFSGPSPLSDVKQISLTAIMYTQDYDNTFPNSGFAAVKIDDASLPAAPLAVEKPAGAWVDQMNPYCKNYRLFYLRSEEVKQRTHPPDRLPDEYVASYTLNRWTTFGLKPTEMAAPAQFVLLTERNNEMQPPGGSYLFAPWTWRPETYAAQMSQDLLLTRHSGGAYRGYADGHAKCDKYDWNAPNWQSGAFHP